MNNPIQLELDENLNLVVTLWKDTPLTNGIIFIERGGWVLAGRKGWNDWFVPCDHNETAFIPQSDAETWREQT